jgi:hypothetical protein
MPSAAVHSFVNRADWCSTPGRFHEEPEPQSKAFENVTVTVTAADGTNLEFTFPGRL